MCRILMYMGKQPIPLVDLLFNPDNSLIRQSYDPKLMSHIQNLAGFGMVVWSDESFDSKKPFYYKTEELPFFDENLLLLTSKIRTNCMLAHVRGVDYSAQEIVVRQNAHPFMFQGFTLALAHNGSLADMGLMKPALVEHVKPEILREISGTTDSEWIYSVLMSQFEDPTAKIGIQEASDALVKTLEILRKTRRKLGIAKASPVNLLVTNGDYLLATRYVFDYGLHTEEVQKAFLEYHSLWFTYGEEYGLFDGIYKMRGSGKRDNIIIASEPLTEDRTTWIEAPEYSMTHVQFENDEIKFRTHDLNV